MRVGERHADGFVAELPVLACSHQHLAGGGIGEHAVQADGLPPLREQDQLGELDHRVGPGCQRGDKARPGRQREVNAEPRPDGNPGAEHDRCDQSRAAEPRCQAGSGSATVRAIRQDRVPVHRLGPSADQHGDECHHWDKRDRQQRDRTPSARPLGRDPPGRSWPRGPQPPEGGQGHAPAAEGDEHQEQEHDRDQEAEPDGRAERGGHDDDRHREPCAGQPLAGNAIWDLPPGHRLGAPVIRHPAEPPDRPLPVTLA